MLQKTRQTKTERFQRCINASKSVRWEISDVIQGRTFDPAHKFLPDGLSLIEEFDFLNDDEKRLVSQIQGRTYANVFGLVERFINAKILEISREYWLEDQIVLEGLIRFSDEELKHQELFRRVDDMAAEVMPKGYEFLPDPNDVAKAVLGKSTWAVLALTLDIELFTQLHYRESIDADDNLSPLWKDVFLFHWREESQHAIMDELELIDHDKTLGDKERDRAVDEFIELVAAVDGILQAQATSDARYFSAASGKALEAETRKKLEQAFLKAYRWQYIFSGAGHPHFQKVLGSLITDKQFGRIAAALETLK